MFTWIWSTIISILGFLWFSVTWTISLLWSAITWIASSLWFVITWTAWFLWSAIVWIAGLLWSIIMWFGSFSLVAWAGSFLFKYVLLPIIGLSVIALSIYLLYLTVIFIIGVLYGDEWIKQRIYSQKIFSIDTITSTTYSVRRCQHIVTELVKKGELERVEFEKEEIYNGIRISSTKELYKTKNQLFFM